MTDVLALAEWAKARGYGIAYSIGTDSLTRKSLVLARVGPFEGRGATAGEALDELEQQIPGPEAV